MKISQKLAISLGIICLFVILSGIIGVVYTNAIKNDLNTVTKITSPTVTLIDDMIIILWKINNVIQEYSIESDRDTLNKLRLRYEQYDQEFKEAESKIKKLIDDKTILTNLDTAASKYQEFKENTDEIIRVHRNELEADTIEQKISLKEKRIALSDKLEKNVAKAVEILEEIAIRVDKINLEADQASLKSIQKTRITLTLMTLLSICSAILIGIFLSKSIIQPINKLSNAASKISTGSFDVEVKASNSNDEINHLTYTFNQMIRSLKKMLEESPRLKRFLDLKPKHSIQPQYELETGSSYIIKDLTNKIAFDILLDKVSNKFHPICITRINPAAVNEKYGIDITNIIWLSELKDKKYNVIDDTNALYKAISEYIKENKPSIILFDRLDYLISKHGFRNIAKFITRLNDMVASSESIMLIPLDPALYSHDQIALLEKEFKNLPKPTIQVTLPTELIDILKLVNNQKVLGKNVTFKDVGHHFNITAPTTQKRIRSLEERGLIRINKQGRNKVLELTSSANMLIAQ
ncbi:MAG: DUF835 domain-containing protein [Nanoarchaeota archaeon]